jgi:hypothetical protein
MRLKHYEKDEKRMQSADTYEDDEPCSIFVHLGDAYTIPIFAKKNNGAKKYRRRKEENGDGITYVL